jgi:large subunit ribosomal protein L19
MLELVKQIEADYLREDIPELAPGDTVRLQLKVVEGNRERLQPFEGVVIAMHGQGINRGFTVRRVAAHGVGVERTFLLHSPRIDSIEVVRRAVVRRKQLYYMRKLSGKAARLRERREQ